MEKLNNLTLHLFVAIMVPISAYAEDVDLSGFEETGDSLLQQLRADTLVVTFVALISAVVGFLALFTKFIDWRWIGISIVGVFFIFGGDNIANTVLGFFKGS